MKFKCISCDHVFEVKEGTKPRCPRCMGIHDLEPLREPENKTESGGAKKWIAPAVVLFIAVGVAVAYISVDRPAPAQDAEGSNEGQADTLEETLKDLGSPEGMGKVPFEATPTVEEFAKKAAGGKDGLEGVSAIFDGIVAMQGAGKWKPHSQREPDPALVPYNASQLLEKLDASNDGPVQVTSWELACLLLAATRSIGLDTHMVELFQFEGEGKPADIYGKFGRYGVSLGRGTASEPPPIFDPFSGRSKNTAKARMKPMNDREAVAPYFGIASLSLLAQRDTSQALKLNEIAIKLAPENPYFRSGRGLVFAASGAAHEALAEFEKAVKQRGDSVFRVNLAEVLLLADPTGRKAETEIQAALDATPEYSRAHGIMAMIHLMRREGDKAETELALAERLDPTSPTIAMFWAQYYASQFDVEKAIEKAQSAVRLSGESVSSLLGLAGIYKATARFDEMRATLERVVQVAGTSSISTEIKEIFGYDPVGGEDEDGDGDEEDVADGTGVQEEDSKGLKLELSNTGPGSQIGTTGLKLGGDSPQLGGKGFGLGATLGDGEGLGQGAGLNLDLDLKKK